jgi:hypothetical protein
MNKEQAQDAWSINHDTHCEGCECFERGGDYEARRHGYTDFRGGCAYCDWASDAVPTYAESQVLAAAHALECKNHPLVKRITELEAGIAEFHDNPDADGRYVKLRQLIGRER